MLSHLLPVMHLHVFCFNISRLKEKRTHQEFQRWQNVFLTSARLRAGWSSSAKISPSSIWRSQTCMMFPNSRTILSVVVRNGHLQDVWSMVTPPCIPNRPAAGTAGQDPQNEEALIGREAEEALIWDTYEPVELDEDLEKALQSRIAVFARNWGIPKSMQIHHFRYFRFKPCSVS